MPAPFHAIATILALYAAGMGAAAQFGKLSVPFRQVAETWPDAGLALGFIVSLISLLGIVFGLVAGRIVTRFGPRRMLIAGLLLGALMSAAQTALPGALVMSLARVVEGLSHLAIVVAAPTLMAQLSSDRWRGAVLTLWSSFFAVTFAILAWAGLPLVAAYGLPALFVAHAGWMLVCAAALWRLMPGDVIGPDAAVLSLSGALRDHATVYRSARIAPPALGWLCYTLTFVSVITVLPEQLAPDDRAWVTAAMPLAGLLVSLTLGVALLRVVTPVQLVMMGFALAAGVALLLLAAPTSPWLAVLLMATLGFVQGGSFAAVPSLNETPEDRALANGAMAQMGNLGNTLGTPVLLALVALGGTGAIYVGILMAFLAGLALHIWQAARRQRPSP